jgi:hypothetical protein
MGIPLLKMSSRLADRPDKLMTAYLSITSADPAPRKYPYLRLTYTARQGHNPYTC